MGSRYGNRFLVHERGIHVFFKSRMQRVVVQNGMIFAAKESDVI